MPTLLPQKIMGRLTDENKKEIYEFSCAAFKIMDYYFPVKDGEKLVYYLLDKDINQLLKLVSKFTWLEKQEKKMLIDLIPCCVEESEMNSKCFAEMATTKKEVFSRHIETLKQRIDKEL